jgi:hypothetical protein
MYLFQGYETRRVIHRSNFDSTAGGEKKSVHSIERFVWKEGGFGRAFRVRGE